MVQEAPRDMGDALVEEYGKLLNYVGDRELFLKMMSKELDRAYARLLEIRPQVEAAVMIKQKLASVPVAAPAADLSAPPAAAGVE